MALGAASGCPRRAAGPAVIAGGRVDGLSGAAGDAAAAVTLPQTLVIFVGGPLVITLLIALAVFGPPRWRRWRAARRARQAGAAVALPRGVARRGAACWVPDRADLGDAVVHYDRQEEVPDGPARQLDEPCWTVECASCGEPFRSGPQEVHFATLRQAGSLAAGRGWTIASGQLRCPACSTVLGKPGRRR